MLRNKCPLGTLAHVYTRGCWLKVNPKFLVLTRQEISGNNQTGECCCRSVPWCNAAAAAAFCVTPPHGLAHRARCAPGRRPAAAPNQSPRSPPAGRTGAGWIHPGTTACPRKLENPRPPPAREASPWQQSPEPTPGTTPSSWQLPECTSRVRVEWKRVHSWGAGLSKYVFTKQNEFAL